MLCQNFHLQYTPVARWIHVLISLTLCFLLLQVAIVKVFGKTPETVKHKNRTVKHKSSGALQYSVTATPGATSNGTTANGTTANGTTANGTTANGTTANGTADAATNHVVHPTVVRTNLPFKRKVNEVRRAATKAKRVAKSQLSRPHKRPSRRPDGTVTSPTDSEKSGPGAVDGATGGGEARVKGRLSSRFSIISFKAFRPKSLSPDKHKGKTPDKRKSKSSSNDKKSKSKPSKTHHRSRSPDKKRRAEAQDKTKKSRSPNKRASLEDERRKSRNRSVSPDKARRASSPDKQRQKVRSPEKHHRLGEGNWLINKFLADEEKTAKPVMNGSLMGSLNGSLSSMNAVLGGANSSPQMSGARNGSTRGLLAGDSNRASPMRGFVNEAFISSPRGGRTHSSLRVTKSVSPEGLDCDFGQSKYRRSISMEAYNKPPASPDKRKRSVLDEGLSPDKRRRFSSPEKNPRQHSPNKERRLTCPDRPRRTTLKAERRLSSTSPPSSKTNSYSSVPERLREKLSLITASPAGSIASILPPSESADTVSVHSSTHSCHSSQSQPKEWV